jgi:hypothetical protein
MGNGMFVFFKPNYGVFVEVKQNSTKKNLL